jgi:hypothetical protein
MIPSSNAEAVMESIRHVVEQLPEGKQEAVWERFHEAATLFQEGKVTPDEFVRRIIPANLFTAEERAILESKDAYPQYAAALN